MLYTTYMLTIICGEDNVASRIYLQETIEAYKKKDYEILRITADQLQNVPQEHSESLSLFGLKKVYVVENLSKNLRRGKSQNLLKILYRLKDIHLLIWEDGVSKRDLTIQIFNTVKEFKPGANVFKLLDACYPDNLKSFFSIYNEVSTNQNDMFLYIMLVRHVRNLLLVKVNTPPASLQSWQVGKLRKQATYWNDNSLVDFYDRLLGLEFGFKTGSNPYSLHSSLEMLACYFLK